MYRTPTMFMAGSIVKSIENHTLYTIHSSEQPLSANVNQYIIEEEEELHVRLGCKRGVVLQQLMNRILDEGDMVDLIPRQWYLYDLKFKYDIVRFNYLNLAFPEIRVVSNQIEMVWEDKYQVYKSILSSFLCKEVKDDEMNEIVTSLHSHMNLTYVKFINHINQLAWLINQKLLTIKLSLFDQLIPPRSTSLPHHDIITLDPKNHPTIIQSINHTILQ